ncbi:MAG: M60 family metallopeptidase [Mediterraneibacter gnavus]
MKRVVSILLAATLMLTSGTVTYATEENPVQMEYQTEGQDAVQAVNGTEQAPLKDIGVVQVSIAPGITLQKSVTFTVGLSGQESQSIELAANQEIQDTKGTVHFSQLPAGTYELTVAAPGFATYTQTIEVNSKSYAVNLMTGFVEGYTYEEGDYHPGVLLIGDVTGDGVIDDTDRSVLVDAIDTEQSSELTDLTGDQKTDLADLEYFAKGYQAEGHTLACIEESVSADAISPKPGEDTNVEGNLEDLLKGEGNVTLSTQGGTEISEEHPVSVEFDLSESADTQIDGILIETNKENPIQKATVDITYVDAEGNEQTVTAPIENGVEHLLRTSDVQVSMDEDGNIQIHLGSQIAVKKVTLTIQGMQNNNNLVEISKVEFVNGMENRIPKPDMDIPTNLAVETGSEEFTLTWDACKNVTGYEVLIEHNGEQDTYTVKNNSLKVTSFNEKKLVNKEQYTAKVQSVNGTWKSGYSESVTAVPKADKKPDAPENVKAVGKYKSVEVSWKNMKNTEFYNLFYREKGQEEYTKIENITTNSYTISELKENVKYEIYLTGVNELGESDPSLTSTAQTTDLEPAVMPKYKQINTSEEGQVSSHIVSATRGRGEMKDSPLDLEGKTAWGTVDNNPASHFYMADWDDGGEYTDFNNKGFTFEFDQPYTMDTIGFQEVTAQGNFTRISLKYWDENGSEHVVDKNNLKIEARTDKNNKRYYFIRIAEPIQAKKISFGIGRDYSGLRVITVSEISFYNYDSLEDDIMGLYEDELHTVLKGSVTEQTIQDLRNRLQTKDEASGEYHPDKDRLEKELDNAEDILNNQLSEPILIHNTITTRDTDRGFSGLNAWQPLGITAAAGEEITLFVGHNTMGTGSNTNLQLVATQYHAESGSVSKVVTTLKTGRNDVTIPKIWSTDEESGGALYIQYTGNNANDRYSVRVNGGVEVPTLDLYGVTDAQERQQRAAQYVEALKSYVEKMETVHEEVHKNSGNDAVEYEYNKANCILGATDILLNTMLFSLPAQQVLSGCEGNAQKLLDSMDAMEGMMNLFYQHKGLNQTAPDEKDRFPRRHLNIRYQRMFAGAFMYAAGDHIGIEWNETAGMMGGVPVQSENGKYVSGRYFGWGIAHEIGHNINQGAYAYAEVTNNYFAVLAQAKDTNDSVRFEYPKVYEKVTSGTTGKSEDVFTQLGMYWQLHLAYDSGYNFKTYDNYEEQLNNLFFARVDTYARNTAKAPAPQGIALTLSGDRDQDFMRLACAAAQKNILEFFERWGMIPNEETRSYAGQFEAETRAIYYVNDDSRVYRLGNSGSSLGSLGDVEAVGDDTTVSVNKDTANQVDFTLTSKTIPQEDVLGYEITRIMISGGQVEKEVVGFTTENQFSDHVTTVNNRVITYEVTVVDKYLNRSAAKTLTPVKIEHDGSLDKEFWTTTTKNMEAVHTEDPGEADEDTPCAPQQEAPILKAVDNKTDTTYTGIAGDEAEVLMQFNRKQVISGLKYTVNEGTAIKDYSIYVHGDNDEWTEVVKGSFDDKKVQTVYFENVDGKYVGTYSTDAVKLVIHNQKDTEISISELDVLGVTGDNVDFRSAQDGTSAIGRLASDYQYGETEADKIPAGSIVFVGSYKGNPAYNVVLLYDQDGNIVGGTNTDGSLKAQQIILADVPETGNIQDVSDGTWIYWIDPQDSAQLAGKQVRAELYRVNDAQTNEGQRLVSDSLYVEVPQEMPEIELNGNQ